MDKRKSQDARAEIVMFIQSAPLPFHQIPDESLADFVSEIGAECTYPSALRVRLEPKHDA